MDDLSKSFYADEFQFFFLSGESFEIYFDFTDSSFLFSSIKMLPSNY